jgi:hypothetical protein
MSKPDVAYSKLITGLEPALIGRMTNINVSTIINKCW